MIDLADVRKGFRSVIGALFAVTVTGLALAEPVTQKCEEIGGLEIIGELEYVSFIPEDTRLKARIDTGAQTSSLSITDKKLFERDGRKWIRFHVHDAMKNELVEFERLLKRSAKIKRHEAEAIERPVVELKIRLGKTEVKREFTLADRSDFEYPVLIGRNVLANNFVVNVIHKFSTSNIEEQ